MLSCRHHYRVVIIASAGLLLLAGCEKVTGDKPKIASGTDEATPAAATPAPKAATPAPGKATPQPTGSWNTVADSAFTSGPRPEARLAATITDQAASATGTSFTATTAAFKGEIPTAPDATLADASTLYLRQGAEAATAWRPWASAAFDEAAGRNVPVLIVIGAGWSHDAKVMDDTVFNNKDIAATLNKDYVTIRVDADERPDIWGRYRMAYEIINKQRAHLPLSVFALPDGRPFDIVSAVPATGTADNPGMTELLTQARDLMAGQRDQVQTQAATIENVLERLLAEPRASDAAVSDDLLNRLDGELKSAAKGDLAEEIRAGRVAQALLYFAAGMGSSSSRDAASELLLSRFRSGQRDHVMGGYFFRVPGVGAVQFGKVLPVQSEFISANAQAYASTGKTLHKEAVTEVLRFCRDWLEVQDGGFYSAQAPDMVGDDSGSYFTWSADEVKSIVGDNADAKVFCAYLNIEETKSNAHVTGRLQQAADAAGVSYEEANKALTSVRRKLTEARLSAEKTPLVDKSLLASWNGDMISAYLDAAAYAGDDDAKAFALKSADRIIENMVSEQQGVAHIMYKGRSSGFGYLEDNVKVAMAFIRCYEASKQKEYLDSAVSLMEYVEARFLDKESGLYIDALPGGDVHGLLKLKRLPLEDDISRSANAVAACAWVRLAGLAEKPDYKARAERMVKAAAQRRTFDTEAVATWGQAGDMVLHGVPEFKK